MYIVGPIVICFSNSKVLLLLLHVILMQISRQCRVDLVLEIDKDELWLFFGYYCGSSRKLWPKCIANFSLFALQQPQMQKTTTTSSISNLVVLHSKIREMEKGKTMGICVNKNAKGTLSLPVPLLFGLKANA